VKSKKILLFILFIIIFITLGTKSFASWYPDAFYDEDKDSYYEIYIGQSIRLSYYGLDDEKFGGQITLNDDTYGTNDDNDKENIFCIQKGQSLPSKGTATVKAIIDIEPGGITMRDVVTRDFSWYTDAEKRSLFRMAYILNQQGEHSRIQYDAEDGDYPPYYSEKQKAVWENIGGFLGITINRESDSKIATTSGGMTSSLTNSDECKEYQESALAYENNGRTALSKKRDTSDVKKSECTYNNESYFKIGPFKYSYAFSLDNVELYDENGNTIKNTNVTKNYNKTKVSIEVLKGNTIPVDVEYSGKPAKGYEVTGVEFEPQKVTLVGKHSLIDSLESIKVPKEDISVDGAKDTVNVEVNLNKYLPDGVSVSDSANAIATITVKVEKLETKKFQINKSDISLQNIESGYIAEISSDSISVSLTGLKSELDKVTPDDIKAVVNLKGINSNKTVDVSLTVPNNTTLKNKVSVKVKVTKK